MHVFASDKIIILLSICILVTSVATGKYSDPNTASQDMPHFDASGAYCGVYCLYAVFKLNDMEVNFCDLLTPDFIGSKKGSSIAELKSAAEKYGITAKPVAHMNEYELENLNTPAILHVKPADDITKGYSHYELFLGFENGNVKLYNPPDSIRRVSVRDIKSRWDGVALLLSPNPISLFMLFYKSLLRLTVLFFVVILIITTVRILKPKQLITRKAFIKISFSTSFILIIISLLAAFLFHFFCEYGFLSHPTEVISVINEHAGSFVKKISIGKVKRLIENSKNKIKIIDVRFEADYKKGHIETAINLPIDCSDEKYIEVVSILPKNGKIVLYSHSTGCRFAEIIAIHMKEDGFEDISIFREGWVEWKKFNESHQQRRRIIESDKSA